MQTEECDHINYSCLTLVIVLNPQITIGTLFSMIFILVYISATSSWKNLLFGYMHKLQQNSIESFF